jgi:hypothetical protein
MDSEKIIYGIYVKGDINSYDNFYKKQMIIYKHEKITNYFKELGIYNNLFDSFIPDGYDIIVYNTIPVIN